MKKNLIGKMTTNDDKKSLHHKNNFYNFNIFIIAYKVILYKNKSKQTN